MQKQVINFIIQKISEVSGIPVEDIDAREPLLDLGLSSYMVAEISAAIEDEFGFKISLLQISNGASIEELAEISADADLVTVAA